MGTQKDLRMMRGVGLVSAAHVLRVAIPGLFPDPETGIASGQPGRQRPRVGDSGA